MTNPRIPFLLSDERPRVEPLDGKPLLVHIVVNVEQWSFDRPVPRALLPGPHGANAAPDIPNYSWAEYGMRAGMPRLLRTLAERDLPASASINSAVITSYPRLAERILEAGWEFVGHGVEQQSLQRVDDERAVITAALDQIERFTGRRPGGWLGPGLAENMGTLDVLSELGVRYVFDWIVDDLPSWMDVKPGPMLSIPYSLEFNDSLLHAVERLRSDELLHRVRDSLVILDRELPHQPRILSIPLHPHLFGVPHRLVHLESVLDLLMARDDVRFVVGADIEAWYRSVDPPSA
jgi:peptidoglycan/xylan/chitin deacetylase (PgdA/CDA1 family)